MGTQFPAIPSSVAGPTNPQYEIARLIRQLQMQRLAHAQAGPQTGLAAYAQPWRGPGMQFGGALNDILGDVANVRHLFQPKPAWQDSADQPQTWRGYAKGGDVRGHGHDTGDPHLDSVLDEVYDAMSGDHPDPEGAAMNYAHLLVPGAMDGYQRRTPGYQAGGPMEGGGGGGPSLADLIMGPGGGGAPGGGGPGPGDGGPGDGGGDQGGNQDVGLVSGPGGGMDDDVAAQSDDGSPVALSNGEFVIPADVVSMLGDGNTEAGAQKLYELIDQIRQQKQGTTDQGEPTPDDIFSQLQSPEGGEEEPEEEGGAPPQGAPPGAPLPPEQQEQPGAPSGMWRGGTNRGW